MYCNTGKVESSLRIARSRNLRVILYQILLTSEKKQQLRRENGYFAKSDATKFVSLKPSTKQYLNYVERVLYVNKILAENQFYQNKLAKRLLSRITPAYSDSDI